jgi:hypothetical protein
LLASSISNNSWFVFSQLASFYFFILFLLFYSFFLFLRLLSLGNLFSSSLIKSYREGVKFKLIIPILVLSGIPPFPIFFVKMLIAMFIISYYNAGVYIIFVIVSNVILLLSYFKVFFTLIINQQSNQFFVWLSF